MTIFQIIIANILQRYKKILKLARIYAKEHIIKYGLSSKV